jgi:hypothetical protein
MYSTTTIINTLNQMVVACCVREGTFGVPSSYADAVISILFAPYLSLFLPLLPLVLSNSPTIENMFSIYVHMTMFAFGYTFISWIYLPYMRENM